MADLPGHKNREAGRGIQIKVFFHRKERKLRYRRCSPIHADNTYFQSLIGSNLFVFESLRIADHVDTRKSRQKFINLSLREGKEKDPDIFCRGPLSLPPTPPPWRGAGFAVQ